MTYVYVICTLKFESYRPLSIDPQLIGFLIMIIHDPSGVSRAYKRENGINHLTAKISYSKKYKLVRKINQLTHN